jgi:hypothetical protein
MGYFARINQRREVIEVIEATEDYVDNLPGTWLETTLDGSFRKNYAGIGYTYDYALDCFIPPRPNGDNVTFYPELGQWRVPLTLSTSGSV